MGLPADSRGAVLHRWRGGVRGGAGGGGVGVNGRHYYNEIDAFAAQWLRNLIAAGHLPDGDVDERSIADVRPDDLRGYAQCHFFAGIGGWPLALRLAGWPNDRPVWTGSCPCQPFSVAGKQHGTNDERHLWPEFARLIRKRRPAAVFGEQVASPAGRQWFAGVRADLEALGYAAGGCDLCAAGIAAPHIRQRLYWVADTARSGRDGWRRAARGDGAQAADDREFDRLVLPDRDGCEARELAGASARHRCTAYTAGRADGLDDAERARLEGLSRHGNDGHESGWINAHPIGSIAAPSGASAWNEFDIAWLRDGTARRIEPGSFPLAHGVPGRVGRLRGYGNAIVPQLAAEFVSAYIEAWGGMTP